MKPIYKPKGKAKEYGDYALNIYTGCPHSCYYCFAPSVLHRDREKFHRDIRPREGIVEATKAQLEREKITGKTIHLCFTCDPYPTGYDTTATREIIRLLKQHGNHVQILTKGDGSRDFDLLDSEDWYGVTYDGQYSGAYMSSDRWADIWEAHGRGIKTWCSFEPVIDADRMDYNKLIDAVKLCGSTPKIDQCKQCAYWSDGDMGKCIPRMTTAAATALSTLQAENAQLRGELEYEQEHANAYHQECGQWEAENEKLRAELEQVTLENNALWTYIEIVDREYRRYMDRGYIDRLDELKKVWKHGQGGRA